MSRLDWVNALPQRWEAKPLRAVADYVVSNVDKAPADGEVHVRLCNYTDVYNNEFITLDLNFMEATATQAEIARFGLTVNDVIITKDSESWDDIAVPALVRETAPDLVCGYHLALLRPRKQHIHGAFLLRCLQAKPVRVQLELAANGVTRFGIPKSDIGSTRLPVPPLNVQRAIADYLDRETARIDALIAAKERLLALLAEKRRALITRAVTRGLDPNAPMKDSGIPWLGEIPAHWTATRIKHVVTLRRSRVQSNEELKPCIGLEDIESWTGRLISNQSSVEEVLVSTTGESDSLSSTFEPGDVLFGKLRPYLAKAWVAEFAGRCTTEALVMQPVAVEARFLHYVCLCPNFIELVDASTFGSKMPRADWDFIGNIKIPLPPATEQRAIVEHITEETARLDALRAATEHSIALLKERRAALISAAVTGQIEAPARTASTADREAVP